MLTEEQLKNISDKVYLLDSSRNDFRPDLRTNLSIDFDYDKPNLGKYKIEDNQENGMKAMAIDPIGADC